MTLELPDAWKEAIVFGIPRPYKPKILSLPSPPKIRPISYRLMSILSCLGNP